MRSGAAVAVRVLLAARGHAVREAERRVGLAVAVLVVALERRLPARVLDPLVDAPVVVGVRLLARGLAGAGARTR